MRILLCLCLIFLGCSPVKEKNKQRPLVVASISPYAFFVKKIAGDDVEIKELIPPGYNPHIFEATPKQLSGLDKASLWIGVGEPYEKQILPVLKEKNPGLITLNLTEDVPLIYDQDGCGSNHLGHESIDRHIWMSPKLAKIQAEIIYQNLIKIAPDYAHAFEKNFSLFIDELNALDKECNELLNPIQGTAILISHPSLGYFCHDYHLFQIPVECEGKSPLSKDLEKLLNLVNTYTIHCVFIQPQFDNKAALYIAKMKNLTVYQIDPYSKDYIKDIKHLAQKIASCNK